MLNILIYGKDNIPQTIDCSIAFHGFEELNARVTISHDWFSLNKNELKKFDVCVGGVLICQHVLNKLGVTNYNISCYPNELQKFLNRKIEKTTLRQFVSCHLENKFVKSVSPKRFGTFKTTRQNKDYLLTLMGLDENEEIYISDLVEFDSEWRVYVKENRIQNICFYRGDPTVFPDPKVIRRMISSWCGPCCYALDVGIIENKTCLVEINDFYSVGNYGLDPVTYADMLLLRWRDLVNEN